MLRQIFYTLLIMSFLGFLLFSGLHLPPAGKRIVQSITDFLQWRPQPKEGPLSETEATIKQFDSSFRSVRDLRTMVVDSNKKNAEQLDVTYKEMRENLKLLLADIDKQTVTNRARLFDQFKRLHQERRQLVENLIVGERSLINLNAQMDAQLREISSWLSQQAMQPHSPTSDEKTRGLQYENLLKDLKSFASESNQLDVMRILLMRKSTEFVDQLEGSNRNLETNFNSFSAQVEIATSEQAAGLWDEYERLEKEQRDIIKNMKVNQEFIGDNQQRIATGVQTIAKNIQYRSDTQLERFQQNYNELDAKRSAALNALQEHQKVLLEQKLTMQQIKETNEYRMENLKMRTNQLLTQYDRVEDYRRTLSSTLDSMSTELRDNDEFVSQRIEQMRESLKQRIEANKIASGSNDISQRIDDAMSRNLDQMQQLRSRIESAHSNMESLNKDIGSTFASNPYYIRMKELQERNKTTLSLMQNGEDQLRSAQERQRAAASALKDRVNTLKSGGGLNRSGASNLRATSLPEHQRATDSSLQERIKDAQTKNQDAARAVKERNEQQSRTQKDRIQDQMQRIRDQQQSRNY
jgi:hypothetical protein